MIAGHLSVTYNFKHYLPTGLRVKRLHSFNVTHLNWSPDGDRLLVNLGAEQVRQREIYNFADDENFLNIIFSSSTRMRQATQTSSHNHYYRSMNSAHLALSQEIYLSMIWII